MSKEHSEWLASLPAAEREALNKGLSALETMADLWAAEINLAKMSETIAGAPDPVKRAFAIRSMVEQGYIEGAYRTYLDYKYGKLPGQATVVTEELRIPDGWRLVPIDPTKVMAERGEDAAVTQYDNSDWEEAKDMAEALDARPIWKAMLDAVESNPSPRAT